MTKRLLNRREFLDRLQKLIAVAAVTPLVQYLPTVQASDNPSLVSITRIQDGNIPYAVEEAIDLLGGIASVTENCGRIMLKPNLVDDSVNDTTNPEIVRTLARMMLDAGKEVSIGEGSAAASGFNVKNAQTYRTHNPEILIPMQQHVFDTLGYTDIANELSIELINLHTGEMVEVEVPDAFVFDTLQLHHTLTEIDLLVSVPRMKTHVFAGVTLGMKNLIGLYCGEVYGTVRWLVHDLGSEVEQSGTAVCIVDMVRANKVGLTVVDGIRAMEGNGPTLGAGSNLVDMNLIIVGTNPLATDMVTARIMGFEIEEIPTFEWAIRAGMEPTRLEDIEVRGETIEAVQRNFRKPTISTWKTVRDVWGNQLLE